MIDLTLSEIKGIVEGKKTNRTYRMTIVEPFHFLPCPEHKRSCFHYNDSITMCYRVEVSNLPSYRQQSCSPL